MPAGWLIALLQALKLLVYAALFCELTVRAGGSLSVLVFRSRPGPLAGAGAGFLLGLGVMSGAILGLALTGLFYPSLIAGVCLALPMAGWVARRDPSPLLAAAREGRALGWPAAAVLACALGFVLPNLLAPENEMDSLYYHLGVPWQFLLAHGARLENVPFLFHMSLPLEMVFSVPLLAGDDRLAKVISFACFAAATAVFAGRSLKRGESAPVWQGSLLALGTGGFFWLVASSKNDMFAASAFVAGALLALEGHVPAGAVLLGLAAAGKPVYAPLTVAWLTFALARPDARKRALPLLLFALPVAPWLAKAWLATGDPAFPLLWRLFDPPAWGGWNQAALDVQLSDIRPRDSSALSDLPVVFAMHVSREHQMLLLLGPGLLIFGGCRYRLAVLIAGGMAVLAGGHMPRYLLPAFWLASLFAAEEAVRLDRRLKSAAVATAVLVLAFRVAPLAGAAPWRDILRPPDEVRRRGLAIFGEAMEKIAVMPPGRIILQGEYRTYLVPRFAVFGGFEGDTPLIWRMVRESADSVRLDVKFRQTGARLILYNYVRARVLERRYVHFPWTDRAIALYRDHVRKRQEIVMRTNRCDHMDGGFNLYRIRGPAEASGPRPEMVPFLPGAEGLMGQVREYEARGMRNEAEDSVRALIRKIPDVGLYHDSLAYLLRLKGAWEESFAEYRRTVKAGIMDDENWSGYAIAAKQTGRLAEAARAFRTAWEIYPMRRELIDVNLATCEFQLGEALLKKGRAAEAEKELRATIEVLNRAGIAGKYPDAAALALLRLARSLVVQGKRGEAAALLREAERIKPGVLATEEARQTGLPPEEVFAAPDSRPREKP